MQFSLQDRIARLASPVAGKVYEGRVARLHGQGDPLEYSHGKQYRDENGLREIVKELQSSKPFTLLHPDALIRHGGVADVVGRIIGARIDGDHVIAQILVTDQRAMDAIDAGMHELSLGYLSVLTDSRHQSQIQIDHCALVPRARCGSTCALQTDAMDCHDEAAPCKSCAMRYTTVIAGAPDLSRNQDQMDELKKQLEAALQDAVTHKSKADKLETELANVKATLTATEVAATNATASLTAERARFDAALAVETAKATDADKKATEAGEKAKMDAQADLAVSVQARVALETQANRILGHLDGTGKVVDRSKISDRDLKCQIIKHVDKTEVPADKVIAYVDGVYEGAITRAVTIQDSQGATRSLIANPTGPVLPTAPKSLIGREAEVAARQEMANRRRNPVLA